MNPKDTLSCEGPAFQVCDNCSSPNLCRVYGSCPNTWPATQINPDPLEQQMAEMRARLDERQAELGLIATLGDELDEIPAYSVRGLLIGGAALILLGLASWGLTALVRGAT